MRIMVLTTDSTTLKKITLVKQIYRKALLSSKQYSNIDKIMAVIGFDLANETILNIIVGVLDPSKTKAGDFPGILSQVDLLFTQKTIGTVPDRGNILNVHRIRNAAQHDARYPNDNELSDCETYTRDFLKKTIHTLWNLDFDQISMVDLVKNEYCKSHLEKAEQLFQEKDYIKAAQNAMTSLHHAITYVTNAITGNKPTWESLVSIDTSGEIKKSRDYERVLEKMRETILFTSLGMDISQHINAVKITGTPLMTLASEEPVAFNGGKEKIELHEAEYIIGYCTNAVLLIKEKVGDVEKPFGQERWFY